MQFKTLEAWLTHIGSLRPEKIDLGLARVRELAERLDLLKMKCPVITIGGTNGKGSTVAGLEAIFLAQGFKVGAFTSPYLFRHTEEVRINGVETTDDIFCQAFAQVEEARGDVSLTLFEFNTLAALVIFRSFDLDVILLEVGLGGRLDAVNIIDADVAVVTSIAIDHADWLGNTRELISREKAGIFREGTPVVCGDSEPPSPLILHAAELKAPLYCQGKDFYFNEIGSSWSWQSARTRFDDLPLPSLALQNMSTVLMTIEVMQAQLPVSRDAIDSGLQSVRLPGRLQVMEGPVVRLLDVSHNPAAAVFLANALSKRTVRGKTRAVFSMLADKDIPGTLVVMKEWVSEWYIAELPVKRAATIERLQKAFAETDITAVHAYASIEDAYVSAMNAASPEDLVVVFGSFYTVAGVKGVL
ncbi:MAG: bifunctional tetrahydrofolate synthase/dihydrofolate synthase [Gammaproteobacteria bacterium]|nr:bifunctional tetrahydrofolate synthase/dihydrofolate synthase [Gammaproteobacteria bacterium]